MPNFAEPSTFLALSATSLITLLDLDAYKLEPVVSFIANLLGHKFCIPIELPKSDITGPSGARFSAKSYLRSRQDYRNPIRRRPGGNDNELPWLEKNSGDAHSVILKDWLKASGQICTDERDASLSVGVLPSISCSALRKFGFGSEPTRDCCGRT